MPTSRRAAGRRVDDQFGALAQPNPFAVAIAHAQLEVDRRRVRLLRAGGDRRQRLVVGMAHRLQFGERQLAGARRQAQHLEHRFRPGDAPLREVPIPQAASAAIEREIDMAAHRRLGAGARLRPPRLQGEGAGRADQGERGGAEQQDHDQRRTPPRPQQFVDRRDEGDLAGRGAQVAHRGEFVVAVGALHPERPGLVGENGQRFGGAEHGFERRAGRERRIGGDHHAGAVGEQRARRLEIRIGGEDRPKRLGRRGGRRGRQRFVKARRRARWRRRRDRAPRRRARVRARSANARRSVRTERTSSSAAKRGGSAGAQAASRPNVAAPRARLAPSARPRRRRKSVDCRARTRHRIPRNLSQ